MAKSPQRRYGFTLFTLAWIALAGLLYIYFDEQLEEQYNPNQSLSSQSAGAVEEVKLVRNSQGHYVATALINGHNVTVLVDTGATRISIPTTVANRLSLPSGRAYQVSTANGTVTVRHTHIDRFSLGGLALFDLDANINPGLPGETILLGMNALRDLEMIQRGDTLTLRKY